MADFSNLFGSNEQKPWLSNTSNSLLSGMGDNNLFSDNLGGGGQDINYENYFSNDPNQRLFSGVDQNSFNLGGDPKAEGYDFNKLFGNIGQGIDIFSGLASLYGGFKGLNMADDSFKFQQDSFNQQFDAQATAYNNQVRKDFIREKNSAANRGIAFEQTEEEYLKKYGI